MTFLSAEILWRRLQERALVEGDMPLPAHADSPWYVRAMLGIAGWIGALFLLGFVGAGFYFVMDNAAAAVTLAALCCGAAYAIFRMAPDKDVATQFALAVSMAGQGLFMIGMNEAFGTAAASAWLACAAFELALALLLPNFVHRVVASAAAAIALALALNRLELGMLVPALLGAGMAMAWLEPRRWAGRGTLWRPLGYGWVLAVLVVELIERFGWFRVFRHSYDAVWWAVPQWLLAWSGWIAAVLVGIVLVGAVAHLLRDTGVSLVSGSGLAALGAAVLVALVSVPAPGLATAMLILLLGFACGNRVLMGLGICALLGFLSHFYYALNVTLLVKSGILAASGVMLLGARSLANNISPHDSGAEAAADAAASIDFGNAEGSHA
ncbi:DUF4401 domain-containing protein [Janthinobacterium sp. 17J80-10]|uniref:DUF4401 domain-containing protein n=1 Tax=Janthinobacterium sp. 17J80-10 TaxID=2497863 RepID=UPI0010056AD9|nr:DUF4401 domain-containing protein [Janthinobacterium sp. 17J80-10]QAU33561.1 DUF4401 domain-containing protein [Janthinobacterium sp. 17J80-10]